MAIARKEFVDEMTEKGFTISCTRNPVFWDEPTEEDIDEGEFEFMEEKEGATDDEEDSNGSRDSESEEGAEQTPDDDK